MSEAIKGPRIFIRKPEPKPQTGLTVQETTISTVSPEKQSAPDFYCPGNLRIMVSSKELYNQKDTKESKDRENEESFKRVNVFFVSPPPGKPDFTHEGLNKFMHSLDLNQIVPDFNSNIKPEYKESYTPSYNNEKIGHFELGHIRLAIDRPGIKDPFIPIGEKPVEPEEQLIIIYPYDRIPTLVYEYQAGIIPPNRAKDDNPEYQADNIPSSRVSHDNPNFDYALYRLTDDQLKEFKKQASEEQSNFT